MKEITVTILMLFSINFLSQNISRELISSSGESFKKNNLELEWSLGELIIETRINNNYYLTQGFHQPDTKKVLAQNNFLLDNLNFNIYPNPTSEFINIKIPEHLNESFYFKLIDINGKIIVSNSISYLNDKINVSKLNQNIYFLQILTKESKILKVIKVLKIN